MPLLVTNIFGKMASKLGISEAKFLLFKFSEKEKQKNEILIWLDNENHMPVGVIVHELKKGTKRLRQGKKKE